MMRQGTYRERATDLLSALFLLLAMALTGGSGPLAAQTAPVSPLQSSSTDAGTGGHRSAPVIAKQQLLVSETRDAKAPQWGDGKPEPLLASEGTELPPPSGSMPVVSRSVAAVTTVAASPFDARAPPAQS